MADQLSPVSLGFSHMFGISEDSALAFSIPATFATAYGFVFAYSRVLLAMARSGLFPRFLMRTYGKYHTPYVAIIFGAVIGYMLCIWVYLDPAVNGSLFSICVLSAFMTYISQFVGYIIFSTTYSGQKRLFRSPLGIFGAVYGIIVFFLATIAVLGFQNDNFISLIVISVLLTFYSIFYYAYSKKKQKFSTEEKIFFPVHVVKCKFPFPIFFLLFDEVSV